MIAVSFAKTASAIAVPASQGRSRSKAQAPSNTKTHIQSSVLPEIQLTASARLGWSANSAVPKVIAARRARPVCSSGSLRESQKNASTQQRT